MFGTRTHTLTRGLALAVALAAIAACIAPQAAFATVERKQNTPGDDPTGRLFISPGRIEQDVQPGVATTVPITLTNDSDGPFDVSLRATDVGQAADPRSVATAVEDGEFGAGDWLEPEIRDIRLEPFEQITFDLLVDPPTDAPTGTNLAGLIVDSTPAEGPLGTEDSDSVFRIEGLIQVFLTVPGEVEHDLTVTSLDVRDTVLLGGQRFVVWDVTFRNDGTVNEHVSGSINVHSLFGNTAHREKVQNLLVLRGSSRTTRVIWRDLPWVGAFTPEARVRGDDAKLVTRTGDRVVILPWWLPVLVVLAVLLPFLVLWWRRRQEWKLYLDEEDEDWAEQQDGDGAF
jgi:hypothetical protein